MKTGAFTGLAALPRAVLFDWDNTLVENWRSIQAAINHALMSAGRPTLDLDQVRLQARHSARDIFPNLFGETWQSARDIFYAHFLEHHLAGLVIMDGAEALLDILRDSGVRLGIVSNKKGDLLRREIEHLGWSSRFEAIVGAQDAEADKPHPAPINLALTRMELATDGVWFVGDTDIDIRAAQAASLVPILVTSEFQDPELFANAKPLVTYANCIELAGFVGGLRNTI